MAEADHPGAKRRREMADWTPVTCLVADAIRSAEWVRPSSSKTDLSGQYGEPEVFTEWATTITETPVLREHRWPGRDGQPDAYRCEHYAPTTNAAAAATRAELTTAEQED